MDLSDRVLGATVSTQLAKRNAAVLLRIGRDRFYRADLAGVECYNFLAAATLSTLLKDWKIADTHDLFNRISPADLSRVPRLGPIAIAVCGAAFQAKKIGGSHPLLAWCQRHAEGGRRKDVVTYGTLKHRALVREREKAKQTAPRLRKSQPTGDPHAAHEATG